MAKLVLANLKKSTLLTQKLNYLNTLRYLLFTAVTGGAPSGPSVIGDFVLVSDAGHNPAGRPPQFGTAVLNAAFQAESNGQPITWTFEYTNNTPFTILGYCVIDPLDGKLVYSQMAPAAVTITGPQQTYTVVPKMLDDTMP